MFKINNKGTRTTSLMSFGLHSGINFGSNQKVKSDENRMSEALFSPMTQSQILECQKID